MKFPKVLFRTEYSWNPLKKNSKYLGMLLHKSDPAHECLINTLQVTIPGLIGAFLWLYFVQPFTCFIVLLPTLGFLIPGFYFSYRNKIVNISVFLFLIAAGQLVIAVFSKHPTVMTVFIFILFFPVVASVKYRYAAIYSLILTASYLSMPRGWYNGVNRIIEICIVFFIILICIFLFEYLFSKIRMRAHFLYLIELLSDAFYSVTLQDSDEKFTKIINKHLFNMSLTFKADFEVEKIFNSSNQKLFHRIYNRLVKAGNVINEEECYFKKNKDYRNFAVPAFIQCRRIFRDITFMHAYLENEKAINALLPGTQPLLDDIKESLNKVLCIATMEKRPMNILDKGVSDRWLKECEQMKQSGIQAVSKDILEFIYGLRCMITDVRVFENILQQEKLNSR